MTAGVFTVNLNFGSTAFPGADRFLQISVRRNAGESFVTLSPRQQIASSPYSIRTLSAAQADTSLDSNQLGGVPANQYLQTNGNGSGLTNLNASSIATGTLDNARLGQIPTANIADSAVTSAKIAGGQVVKSVNTLRDDVTLAAGTNITITPAGNTLTIASTGGGGNAILNQTTQQPGANFNISGDGTAGGTLSGGVVNATTQYNIGGIRVLRAAGTRNLFAGVGAGAANTLGTDNAFFGFNAGLNNTGSLTIGGRFNSFFGANAGQLLTQGISNSFFGSDAGGASTASNDGSFFGTGAGSNNAGDFNSFFGSRAGADNKGTRNSFFGNQAGRQVIFGEFPTATGDDNAFFGSSAGARNLGSSNSFFGMNAGFSNTSGVSNSFFGRSAGRANIEGNNNSFFGMSAGDSNTSGNSNSFFGTNAGFQNTGGNSNSFFGRDAGRGNIGGSANSFFGTFAGDSNTTGSSNSFFGRNAGLSNTMGSNNTIIGNNANVTLDSNLSYATAIGADAVVASSATIVLGRDSASNAGDWVGIGVPFPLRKLDVNGRARIRSIPSEPSFCPSLFQPGWRFAAVRRVEPAA